MNGLISNDIKGINIRQLILRNIFLYKSFYRLIAIAVIVAVAVITGSLVVGDSVRSTLVKRVDERLGKTETIIFSQYSFLNDSILENLARVGGVETGRAPSLRDAATIRGVLLSNGFVSVSGKFIPVMVWGVDDLEIKRGQAKINNALFDEIKPSQTKEIVLRLPAAGMVPLGSMFVTDTYTTSLRLELDSIVSIEQGGNMNLKNEQTIPFNIFVNREELAETMDTPGKINVILSDRIISKADFASAWNYELSGLNVETENDVTNVTSDRIFIQNKVVETLCKQDSASNRIYAYLANSLRKNNNSIPYSFITAVDYFKGQPVNPNEIILSDYAARRLNVRLNDTVSVSYFVSRQFKTLVVDSVFLKVGKIVPLEDLQADNSLQAEFPGLSNVERCTDWNSDLPINMNLITDEDEDYWRKYKNTPKAIVPYSTLAPRWENAYGSATALHIRDTNRLKGLSYEMFDIQVIHPRESGIMAAKLGVDFSGLFLSLGFFIIISAIMLMMVPLSEMLFRRRDELNLLKATGFSNKRISRLLWRESAPVVFFSAIGGIAVGLAYTYLVLFLLGSVWKGATHTEGFRVYLHLTTIVTGALSGIILSLVLLYIRIVRASRRRRDVARRVSTFPILNYRRYLQSGRKHYAPTFVLVGLLVGNIFFVKSALLFVCTGIIFLLTGWTWIDYVITKKGANKKMPFDFSKLIWSSLLHTKKQVMLSFITLASGVFIVFSVGLNRQEFADSSQIQTATGGFSLWCETSVPVYHNIQTEEGRAKLALKDLPKDAQVMQLLKYSADDASCLNLNKVLTPNVLGVDMEGIAPLSPPSGGKWSTSQQLRTSDASRFPPEGGLRGAIPALVDETVLQWSLGKKLGYTIFYTGEKGETVPIVLAGTLPNTIFQGYILIDKSYFSEIWSEISGSEIMLVKVPDTEIDDAKMLISQALNNYGVRVMTTGERLKMFYSVTDTYLTIFLTLGGLGLLLGIFSFIIVVRKNIIARLKEITLYRSLGFDEKRMVNLLYKENILIPLCAILIGALGSLLGVSAGFGNVNIGIWGLVAVFLVIFILCVMVFVKVSVRNYLRQMWIKFANLGNFP
jgi:putative ABC transport system permease protein